jgi:hypothetical protein
MKNIIDFEIPQWQFQLNINIYSMDIYYGFYQATQLKRVYPLVCKLIFIWKKKKIGKKKTKWIKWQTILDWDRSAKRIIFFSFFILNSPFNPIFLGHQDLLRHIDPEEDGKEDGLGGIR